jgi:glycosyltransferase domain-containing protein
MICDRQEVSILNNLTIIVPTFKRQKFALRLMDYWSDKDAVILVLDGSPEPINKPLLSHYPDNISYVHKPESIYERIHESLELIRTDYVILAGDDEFYIPSALAACLKKLNSDNEIVACCGRSVGFEVDKNTILGLPQYDSFAHFNLDSTCPIERINRHMGEYVPRLIYAVCRTSSWVRIWKEILVKEFDFYAAAEIQFEICMCINGKSLILPELMWLRSYGESDEIQHADASLNPKKRIDSWWFDESKISDKFEFNEIMSQALIGIGYKKDPEVMLDYAIKRYIEKNLVGKNDGEKLLPSSLLILKKMLRVLSNMLRVWRDKWTKKTLHQRAKFLNKNGVLVDFKSLEEIERNIRKYHGI